MTRHVVGLSFNLRAKGPAMKLRHVIAGVTPVALFSQVHAAVPEGAEAVFTGLATDFGTVAGYAFVALAAITGGWLVFDMVKKGAKKAAK